MQFIKLKTISGCCSGWAKNETHILEWCVLSESDLFDKIFKELKIKPSLKLKNYLLRLGKIRNNGCENCKIVYMFQRDKMAVPLDLTRCNIFRVDEFLESAEEDLPCNTDELEENYYLPKWLVYSNMPNYATKNGKRISYKEDKFKVENYDVLQKYSKGELNNNISFDQINSLLRIEINDYDWSNKKGEMRSGGRLFQKIEGTFAYIEKHYDLPDWIDCDTKWPKPVNKIHGQLIDYFMFLIDEIENMPYSEELLKIKVSDIEWPFAIPNSKDDELLFTKN